jgi:hypothetical protein
MNKETRMWFTGLMLLAICAYNIARIFSVLQDGTFDVSSTIYILWAFLTGFSGIYFFFEGLK